MDHEHDIDLASGVSAFEAKHFSRAMQLLSPHAQIGNAEAQYRLGIMYQNGLGTVHNSALAFRWMREAAQQNHGLAHHGLGFMYLEGNCVDRDDRKAADCFAQGVEQGLEGSMIALAQLYEEGRGVERDRHRAQVLYQQAGLAEPKIPPPE